MKNRLIEIVKKSLVKNIDYTHKLAENITEDLLAAGAILPPCKAWDMVYYLTTVDTGKELNVYDIFIGTVQAISYDGKSFWAAVKYTNGLYYHHTLKDFGESVFLTLEEAEKALAERSEV